jgi:RNA polymerase sigma factor (sigma-70 family)
MQTAPDLETLFLRELPTIERIVGFVCGRHRLDKDAADEFGSQVKLKLIENDYQVLRQFKAESSLYTYLNTVIQRLFLDYRAASWGSWRPCVEARRGGPVAVLVDQLLNRDGLTVDEALETITSNHRVQISRAKLIEIRDTLAVRHRRVFVSDEALKDAAGGGDAEADLIRDEGRPIAERLRDALQQSITTLPPQDQLVIRLRFAEGFSIAKVAQTLRLDQKPLYRRLDRLLSTLRTALETRGFRADAISAFLGDPAADDLGSEGKQVWQRSI